jgi:hypothetical protein
LLVFTGVSELQSRHLQAPGDFQMAANALRKILAVIGAVVLCSITRLTVADTPIFITNQNFEVVTEPGNPSIKATSITGNFWTNGMGVGGAAQLGGQDGAQITFSNGDVWTRSSGTWRDQNSAVKTTVDTPGWTQPSAAFGVQTTPEQGTLGAYVNNLGQGTLQAYSSQLGVGQSGVQITANTSYTLSIDAKTYFGGTPAGAIVLSLIANPNNSANGATAGGAVMLTGTGLNGFSSGTTQPGSNWATYSIKYDPANLAPFVGDYLYIGFGSTADGSAFGQTNFDNVTLTAAEVPEPSSLVLTSVAAILCLTRMRLARRDATHKRRHAVL